MPTADAIINSFANLFDRNGVYSGVDDDTYILEDHVEDDIMEGYIYQQHLSFHSINYVT